MERSTGAENLTKGIRTCALLVLTTVATCALLVLTTVATCALLVLTTVATCALLVLTTVARRITAICARLRARREGRPAQFIGRRKWRAGQQRLGAAMRRGTLGDIPLPHRQLVATYRIALLAAPLWRLLVMVCTGLGTLVAVLVLLDQGPATLGTAAFPFVVAYALGVGVRARRDRISMLEERTRRLAEAQQATAARGTRTDRPRDPRHRRPLGEPDGGPGRGRPRPGHRPQPGGRHVRDHLRHRAGSAHPARPGARGPARRPTGPQALTRPGRPTRPARPGTPGRVLLVIGRGAARPREADQPGVRFGGPDVVVVAVTAAGAAYRAGACPLPDEFRASHWVTLPQPSISAPPPRGRACVRDERTVIRSQRDRDHAPGWR